MTTPSLMDAIRQHHLLETKQMDELNAIQTRFADPKALAMELIQRGWLSPFQVNQLLNGKGQELVLGSYILLERLGEGGMGQVFKARHRMLKRISAIKLIRKERLESPDAVRRFQREVRSAAALSHPNIVRAYDADEIAGTHLLVMEYLEGAIDLSKLVKKNGPLPVPQACEYIRQAALGLQHAHEKGMVHRDVKPANLILTNGGKVVKILDMGLARLDHPGADEDDRSSTMTQEGTVLGTPDYLAPEQALDPHTADIRADLYSLGCAFYFLLTGSVPFPGGTLVQKINKHQFEEPMPVEVLNPEVTPEVAEAVRKLMAKRPVDRYQTPAEVVAAVSNQSSGLALAEMANTVTITGGEKADVEEVGRDALASAFSYISKRDDTIAYEQPQMVPPKPRYRRWLLLGVAVGFSFLVGLVVMLFVVFQGFPEQKQPVAKQEKPIQVKKSSTIDPPQEPTEKEYVNTIGMKLVRIEAGSFQMGWPKSEHVVEITKPFYIGKYEVTQEEYEAIMQKNPSVYKATKRLPVDRVNWDGAKEFCRKLTEKERQAGKITVEMQYTLPTDAEWEYCCRAGTKTPFHCGETLSTDQANCNGELLIRDGKKGVNPPGTKEVGSYAANAWGLHDMHGNAWEWCEDAYETDIYSKGITKDPLCRKGVGHVLRGGSWWDVPDGCGSAVRVLGLPEFRWCFGFRVVLRLSPQKNPITIGAAEEPSQKNFANSIGTKLVRIEPGMFQMGSPKSEQDYIRTTFGKDAGDWAAREKQHEVEITKLFYIGKFEVTQGEYEAVMQNNPSWFKNGKHLPVDSVSWNETKEFCRKLTEKERLAGKITAMMEYALPTEAEWEYCCRAGTMTPFHFGETISTDQANYNGKGVYGNGKKGESRGRTMEVGSFAANAWGLHDMHGNVWEWCEDAYHPDFYTNGITKDPLCKNGPERVVRGGSQSNTPEDCRSATRNSSHPEERHGYGFRVVLRLSPQKNPLKFGATEEPTQKEYVNTIGMKLVRIEPGTFQMGSPKSEQDYIRKTRAKDAGDRVARETQHEVEITRPFYIGKYEVTQEEYEAVMQNNPSKFKNAKRLPVEQVSWNMAKEFCRKLTEKERLAGKITAMMEYSLPTEAEWEYCCRAGTKKAFHFGEKMSPDQANYNNNRVKTTEVGKFAANAWGLHDMHGNVWEWCEDSYDKDFYSNGITKDPLCTNGHNRVLRGGSWDNLPQLCRSANRNDYAPAG